MRDGYGKWIGNEETKIEWRGIRLYVTCDCSESGTVDDLYIICPCDDQWEEGSDDIADFLNEEAFEEIIETLEEKARENAA